MKYVRQQIKDFIESNITQEFPDYNPDTVYTYENIDTPTLASVVRYNGYQYRSVVTNNKGNNPVETEGVYWTKWKVSNTYAMLDQQSLTKTVANLKVADANYLSTDTAIDIPENSLVWDMVGNKMYESVDITNDLPNADFTDELLWKNKSDIIVRFTRGRIDNIGIGYFTASKIKIEHYDAVGAIIPEATQELDYSVNNNIYDLIDYIYEPYQTEIDRSININIFPLGATVKVTLEKLQASGEASCGFMVGGQGMDMGMALDNVPFSFTSYSRTEKDAFGTVSIVQREIEESVDFYTKTERAFFSRNKRRLKEIYDEIVMFILDPSENSEFENLITLGKIQSVSPVASQDCKNMTSWSIFESI